MHMANIVIATDFSAAAGAALKLATTLARDTQARLLIVHVDTPEVVCGGEELDTLIQPIESSWGKQQLEETQLDDARVRYERHLLTGNVADEIVRFAEQVSADLIVVGTHGRTGAFRMLIGGVAESLLRRAPCPVLTVKAEAIPDTHET